MIKIAVVDDDEYSIARCRNIISSVEFSDVQTEIFDDGKRFCNAVFEDKEPFDIIILDIDMPDITGFDIARKLREDSPDIIIMFYTAHEQYVFKSFEFQPFRYIRKEFAVRELPFALEQAIELLKKRQSKNITLKIKEYNQMLSSNEVMYFETNGRKCDVCLNDGERISISKSFSEMLSITENADFFVIHKGISVNLKYVQEYDKQSITLKNGILLPMSRRNYLSFKAAMMNYLRYE